MSRCTIHVMFRDARVLSVSRRSRAVRRLSAESGREVYRRCTVAKNRGHADIVAVAHGCTKAASKVRVVGNGKRETGGQREVLGFRGRAASGRAVPDIVVVGWLGESVLESGLRLGVAGGGLCAGSCRGVISCWGGGCFSRGVEAISKGSPSSEHSDPEWCRGWVEVGEVAVGEKELLRATQVTI